MKNTFILCVLFLCFGCTYSVVKDKVNSRFSIEKVKLPENIFLPLKNAIAYRATGKKDDNLRDAKLSLIPLLKKDTHKSKSFDVYALDNDLYRKIKHKRRGSELVIDMIADKTYVIVESTVGHIDTSLNTMCRWSMKKKRWPVIDLTKICTQILCSADQFSEKVFFNQYDIPVGPEDGIPAALGGFNPIPRDMCNRCTQGIPDDSLDPPEWEFICKDPVMSPCDSGELLFKDNFESDTAGNLPSSNPSGAPIGDQLYLSGDVTVVNNGSNLVRLNRTVSFAVLDAITTENATSDGSYCIKFDGQAVDEMGTPLIVTFQSTNGVDAWQLIISHDQVILSGGGSNVTIPGDFTAMRNFRFNLNLDLHTYDMYLDNQIVVDNFPLIDSTFESPFKLKFMMGKCILECFEASYLIDNIQVTKLL